MCPDIFCSPEAGFAWLSYRMNGPSDPEKSQKPRGPGSITRPLRIESTPGAGQVHTTLWLGDVQVRASPAQVQAAARVAAGLELADGDLDLLKALDLIATPPSGPVPDHVSLVSGAATLVRLKPAEVSFGEVRGLTKRTRTRTVATAP